MEYIKDTEITYAELLKHNRNAAKPAWRTELAVVQNVHLELYLQNCLCYCLNDWGGEAVCRYSGTASYFEDCAQLLAGADNTLVCLDLSRLAPEMDEGDSGADGSQRRAWVERAASQLRLLAERLAAHTDKPLFWLGFHNRYESQGGELLAENTWNQAVAELNGVIASLLRPNWYFLDLNGLVFSKGAERFFDGKLSYAADMPYSFAGTLAIARLTGRYIRACRGLAKKCVVLDCDNTLWGGVLSEDGFNRIRLGELYPGKAYQAFQRELLKLWKNGILLALCSKNDAGEVWEVFDRHPDMLLKREHIAAARINWEPKPENLRRISDELGIGLSSMVLVDDSPAECLEVSLALPEVTVLRLEAERPHRHAALLRECGLFDRLRNTEEDAHRNAFYLAERERRELSGTVGDTGEYLRILSTVLTVSPLRDVDLARVLQLSGRANRLNAAGGPVGEDCLRGAGRECFCLRARDRYGDLGLVGFAVVGRSDAGRTPSVIEAFTLSCRALGRRIEDAFLEWCAAHAEKVGGEEGVCFRYVQTEKNRMIAELLERHGFERQGPLWRRDGGGTAPAAPIEIHECG